ncbi:MAG: NAD(P)-dependent oxidoreductase [Acidobacteriota bacterium]
MIPKRILVTGAAGFIGRHLTRRLLADGVSVRALLLAHEEPPHFWRGDLRGDLDIVRGDVTDPASIAAAVRGVDAVAHLAAVVVDWGPEELFERVTVGGTETVMRAAAAVDAKVLLASSIVVYGAQLYTRACPEETPYGVGLGPYSRAKIAQEKLAWRLADELGVELTVVRPANVYGPHSGPWVEMVLPLLRTRQVTLVGGGDFDAGLSHVDNLVELMILALAQPQAVGRAYNGADGFGVTWKRYFGDLARLIGAPAPRSVPRSAAAPLAVACEALWRVLPPLRIRPTSGRPPLTREAINLVGSACRIPTARAEGELGYRPRVDYGRALEGIAATLVR